MIEARRPPACHEGLDLARRFLLRAGEAFDKLDQTEVIALRNGLIRAYWELAAHRAECPRRNMIYLGACPIAGIRLAREKQVNVRVIPRSMQ